MMDTYQSDNLPALSGSGLSDLCFAGSTVVSDGANDERSNNLFERAIKQHSPQRPGSDRQCFGAGAGFGEQQQRSRPETDLSILAVSPQRLGMSGRRRCEWPGIVLPEARSTSGGSGYGSPRLHTVLTDQRWGAVAAVFLRMWNKALVGRFCTGAAEGASIIFLSQGYFMVEKAQQQQV